MNAKISDLFPKDVPNPPLAFDTSEILNFDEHHEARQVSGLRVAHHEVHGTISLYLKDPQNDKTFVFCLSPPAAKYLQVELKRNLKEYLNQEKE